ncbi:hypothetical protein EGT67_02450 [Prescottella agglutinans]|uniref:Uncharacterized protein n=1 Tax=Prescottella agglutinans TaxID=1644129 RepID=A0A3S3BX75_9NOCA|nr:hypothetical protein [Prescottella agglutinans]RVW11309.1 hypothetical protein EGT67_02450 [Prescottella agglutinans]
MNSRADAVAHMRGMFVGSLSGAISIAAHGLGGGTAVPSEESIVLLVAASAVVGAAVASVRSRCNPLVLLAAVLAAGQGIGHFTLTLASDHGHGLNLPPQMIAAHAAATAVGAVLVRAAEAALLGVIASVVRVVVAVLSTPPVPDVRRWTPTVVRRVDPTSSRIARAAGGTRGPPTLSW